VRDQVHIIAGEFDQLELRALFTGEYDAGDAVCTIKSGAGGTDAQDWAEMLLRMYRRWAERRGFTFELDSVNEGQEAGISTAEFIVRGRYAYGLLRAEHGVHRLVRISPFDAARRRHTSFTKVELWPDIQGTIDIEISEKDLRIETYRSSGAGGQNVQKNDTAVRLIHIPTGLVVAVQNQRSQGQNRERALQILKSRLLEIELKKREEELSALKGENVNAEWGNQIRSYVLHPYHIVKDHRTGYEDGNTDAVLDGRLTPFMNAYLQAKAHSRWLAPAAADDE
jgi:peptide chain release factor 2